ncbi:hypothetical protein C6P08_06780 [Weissella confusa]|uniref:hypothetical protein n=1 Tax=Weissella TaxID=46255 RepID=UPI0010929E1E|nr:MULTISPECIES: hypothetical protein [Weissella]MBJ7694267.1 hypothetical protein [Weissella confusa]NFA01871.1 hypothetical protein [Weissella cibaria]QBZ04902.1 hypothetical protein C6P08_06780 [Weissella confusa]
MIRFPNPGSNIEHMISMFRDTFSDDSGAIYSVDDIALILAQTNNASAVGKTGEAAFKASQRKDKSRDSIYNQAKAYTETYRWLGWLAGDGLSDIEVTTLGNLILNTEFQGISFFEASFLRWTAPNSVINTKSSYDGYPVLNVLRTSRAADGKISRDEIITGPMTEKYENLASSSAFIKKNRLAKINPSVYMEEISDEISVNTQKNYTRLMIAGIQKVGWFEKKRNFFELTIKGQRIADDEYEHFLRLADQNDADFSELVYSSFFYYLKDAMFDVSNLRNPNIKVFGSPYQLFNASTVDKILLEEGILDSDDVTSNRTRYSSANSNAASSITEAKPKNIISTHVRYIEKTVNKSTSTDFSSFLDEQGIQYASDKDFEKVVKAAGYFTKEEFYPFIGILFSMLGFEVKVSPHGQNAQREDLIISFENRTIPVEIKSKTEVSRINIKSIEQALENKILLKARKYGPYRDDDSSFVVGFDYPTSGSKVDQLIRAYAEQYDIQIAMIDLRTLLRLALDVSQGKRLVDLDKLAKSMGMVEI